MKHLFPLIILFLSCQKSQPQTDLPAEITYQSTPQSINIAGGVIREASGITSSSINSGALWVNQDSGNPPMLYLLNYDGNITDSLMLKGATNRDWEDIAAGDGPVSGKSYLYVGDIGDNDAKYNEYVIYRFEEPAVGTKETDAFDRITFTYEDGARDAEAMLIDNNTKNIYVITKRDTKSRVYKIAYPQSTSGVNQASFLFELNFTGVVSAAVSRNGEELLVKTYTEVFHYKKDANASIEEALQNTTPKKLGYQLEPQGEAISFSEDGNGFFTLSEEAMGVLPVLYFYPKVKR